MTQRDLSGRVRACRRTAAAAVATLVVVAAGCGDDHDGRGNELGPPAEVMAEGRPTDDVLADIEGTDLTDPWFATGLFWPDCEDGTTLHEWTATDPDSGEDVVGWGFTGDVWHAGEMDEDNVLLGECRGQDQTDGNSTEPDP